MLVLVIAGVSNCSTVALGIVNVSAHLGSYERRAGLPYGVEPRQLLDVYVPRGATHRPMIVFWYGGMWVRGSREQYRFVGAALANAGYVAVLPDYRVYPEVQYPAFIEDAALAVRWARDHAAEIGGDADALFLMGHSAGAHIAATLVLDKKYLRKVGGTREWVRGWIGLSGPYALELRTPLLHQIFHSGGPETWRPIMLARGQSQLPATLLIHGTDDTMVHPRETVQLEQLLLSAGVAAECRLYPYRTHTAPVAAFALGLGAVAPTLHDVQQFVERTLAGRATAEPCPKLQLRREWSPGSSTVFNGS